MTKEEAVLELANPMYDEEVLSEDFQFVLKKLGFTEDSFYQYIDAPEVPHEYYGLTRRRLKDWRYCRPTDLMGR